MRPFAALERFFERVFERPSARLFHARLQPIQLQRRVERAMETGRLSTADRVVVPNRYVVRLAPSDLTAFGDLANSLELELADAALRFARAHHYAVSDRPAVRFVGDASVAAGDAHVDASFSDGAVPMPPAVARQPAGPGPVSSSPQPSAPAGDWADAIDAAQPARTFLPGGAADPDSAAELSPNIRSAGRPRETAAAPVPAPPLWQPRPEPTVAPPPPHPPSLAPADLTRTMTFAVPTIDSPVALLREFAPDGSQRQMTLDGAPVTIGRATDNFLVVSDARVSRYHGRLQARSGALVYSDLGSTNGSRVNGIEIDEVVLGVGDRIEIGDTVLVVESASGA